MIYVTITNKKLVVGKKKYPLTKEGCVQAGADLRRARIEQWLHSSSVDHSDEHGFDEDIHALMRQGWQTEQDKADAPRHSLYRKVVEKCDTADFRKTLTSGEKKAFSELKKRVKEMCQ